MRKTACQLILVLFELHIHDLTLKAKSIKLLLTTIADSKYRIKIMKINQLNKLILLLAVSVAIIASGCSKNGITKTENTKMEHLTAATFRQKVFNYEKNKEWKFEGDKPCIIDFYADWCGPCKMVAPVLEDLSKEYDGKVQIYKVDTDKEQELASVFGIQSIPTILFIPVEGKPQASLGALPKETFIKTIEDILLVKAN